MLDLKTIVDQYSPDLLFLSEPWLFQSDLPNIKKIFPGYIAILNSDDKFDPDIALQSTRAHGGCLVLYKHSLEPFIREIGIESSRILPLYLCVPGYPRSAHFAIYLPTSGKDAEYIECLAKLKTSIADVIEDSSDTLVYIRGDANASYLSLIHI